MIDRWSRLSARLIADRRIAAAIVIAGLLLGGASLFAARSLGRNDDLLVFLPAAAPEVRAFREISARFGILDVALVGIETEDALEPDFFQRLQRVTKRLNESPPIAQALSLANVEDFTPAEGGGIETDLLVRSVPIEQAARKALREKVMSRDLVVGQMIARDARAVLIYCFPSHGADPKAFVDRIRQIVETTFPKDRLYFSGMPFISSYVLESTERDVRKLVPWVAGILILLTFFFLGDPRAAALSLVSTGLSIAMPLGVLGLLGGKLDPITSAMPLVGVVVGSVFPFLVLARVSTADLSGVAPAVIGAGVGASGSLLSFLAMDIEPLQKLGALAAAAVVCALALSLTFVPAGAVLLGVHPRREARSERFLRWLSLRSAAVAGRPRATAIALLLTLILGAYYALRIDTRADQAALFSPQSPPARANDFLLGHFGGFQFIQLAVEGDLTEPEVLREVDRLADRLALIPGVSSVQHIADVIKVSNEAMEGERRIPDDAAKVKLLFGLLAGKQAIHQLVTADQKQALIHVKLAAKDAAQVERRLAEVERVAASDVVRRYAIAPASGHPEAVERRRESLILRTRILGRAHGVAFDDAALSRMRARLALPAPQIDPKSVAQELSRFLRSAESPVDLADSVPLADELGSRIAALGEDAPADAVKEQIAGALNGRKIAGAVVDETLVEDLATSIETPLREIRRKQKAAALATELIRESRVVLPAERSTTDDRWRGDAEGPNAAGPNAAGPNAASPNAASPSAASPSAASPSAASSSAASPSAASPSAASPSAASPSAASPSAASPLPPERNGARFLRALAAELPALDASTVLVQATDPSQAKSIEVIVSGQPAVNRALSASTTKNQLLTAVLGLGLAFLILWVVFRSLRRAAWAVSPVPITMLAVHGGMGIAGARLDAGTSVVGALILGAGVSFGVLLASSWLRAAERLDRGSDRGSDHGADRSTDRSADPGSLSDSTRIAADAARDTGPAILATSLTVAAAFSILTLAESRSLHAIGGLVSAAIPAAALFTFLAVPVLAPRSRARLHGAANHADPAKGRVLEERS